MRGAVESIFFLHPCEEYEDATQARGAGRPHAQLVVDAGDVLQDILSGEGGRLCEVGAGTEA